MGNWGEGDRFDRGMFDSTNRITFLVKVSDLDAEWWKSEFFDPHGLTPEMIGDRLSASWDADKTMQVHLLDGVSRSFGIKVHGSFGNGDYWVHDRILDMGGQMLKAEEMFLSPDQRDQGLGRKFMQDAHRLCLDLGLDVIRLAAADVGRYAWLRCGFLPDQGSWDTIRRAMMPKLIELQDHLSTETYNRAMALLIDRNIGTARLIATLRDEVPSEIPGPHGAKSTTLGRALLLEGAPQWTGMLEVRDEVSVGILNGE